MIFWLDGKKNNVYFCEIFANVIIWLLSSIYTYIQLKFYFHIILTGSMKRPHDDYNDDYDKPKRRRNDGNKVEFRFLLASKVSQQQNNIYEWICHSCQPFEVSMQWGRSPLLQIFYGGDFVWRPFPQQNLHNKKFIINYGNSN